MNSCQPVSHCYCRQVNLLKKPSCRAHNALVCQQAEEYFKTNSYTFLNRLTEQSGKGFDTYHQHTALYNSALLGLYASFIHLHFFVTKLDGCSNNANLYEKLARKDAINLRILPWFKNVKLVTWWKVVFLTKYLVLIYGTFLKWWKQARKIIIGEWGSGNNWHTQHSLRTDEDCWRLTKLLPFEAHGVAL